MSGLFGGDEPKVVKPEPPKPVPPVPTLETGEEAGDIARRKRPRGFAETFLTGDLIPETEKKRRFG